MGALEDVISMETIDRIDRAAKTNKRFHDLIGGVWYYRASDESKDASGCPDRIKSLVTKPCKAVLQFPLQSQPTNRVHHD
jgi:hypothetical protein